MTEPGGPQTYDPTYDTVHEPSLAALLDEQLAEVESALVELPGAPEAGVHEARVALRRLRSTLTLYASLLDPDAAGSLRRELSWLAGELGPARDAQVLVDRMHRWLDGAPDQVSEVEVAGLLAHFERGAEVGFTRASAALASERFNTLTHNVDRARLRPLVAGDAQPVPDLVARNLVRLLRDLDEASDSSDEQLHDLRKAVKRTRYARGRQDDVDVALKRVQTVLGEHQDSVVARQALAELPPTDLVTRLLRYEHDADTEAHRRLVKAFRKLRRAADRTEQGADLHRA